MTISTPRSIFDLSASGIILNSEWSKATYKDSAVTSIVISSMSLKRRQIFPSSNHKCATGYN
ncbi:hypothetical protein FHX64_000566 [Microbacter margulisiae]|uniref:Uncharacterized protein n=1 Tax=Microbacter margulisiae TaxID=1350067 RepID=A0A7W5DQE3_9PORP|nr:hypothetical protein [Microbacter margulisiae]